MMELNFIKCGDYYIPDIKLEKPNIRLGKWGRMRREYLRLANPVLFSEMVLSETLYEHCAEIEETAKKRMDIIVGFRKDLKVDFTFPNLVFENEEQFIPLSTVVEDEVPEKYFFSDRAVAGMMKNRDAMNKGRAQDITKPCNTVGAHLAKVSLNSTDPVLMVNGRYRRFTPREVARIQSFPETFELVGSESAQYRALGNAIPPVMFWHVADAVSEQFPISK